MPQANKEKQAKRILSVTVRKMVDSDPDASYMGEYSNEANSRFSIDRKHSLDCPEQTWLGYDTEDHCNCGSKDISGEYRYFNPSFNYLDKSDNPLPGETEDGIRQNVKRDYERVERLNRGDWGFIGIGVDAEILIGDHIQTIRSGGLWGIESDSDNSYLEDVILEEKHDLKEQLSALGFSKRSISTAFKTVKEI